jgi:pimeloyl-ACP methyl ester carboxylesterase
MRPDHAIALRTAALGVAATIAGPLAWLARGVLGTSTPPPPPIAAPRRVLVTSAGRVCVYEAGDSADAPVVLLHDVGPAGCAYEVRALFDALRDERAVVAADLPGYGESERRAEPLDRDGYVRFVEELVADVAERAGARVDLVAAGRTGELAARAALRSPSHLRSLALIAPTGFTDHAGALAGALDQGERALRRWLATGTVRPIVHRALTSRPVLRGIVKRRTCGAAAPHLVDAAHALARLPNAATAPLDAWLGGLADRYVVADVYDELPIPTCFVHGDQDRAAIASLTDRHPGFRRAHVAGASALFHVLSPTATVDALRAFWRSSFGPQLRLLLGGRPADDVRGAVRSLRPARLRAVRPSRGGGEPWR